MLCEQCKSQNTSNTANLLDDVLCYQLYTDLKFYKTT